MSRELTRQIAIISLTVIFLIGSWAYYQYRSILGRLDGVSMPERVNSLPSDTTPIDTHAMDSLMVDSTEVDSSEFADTSDPYTPINWFEENFQAEQFVSPSSKYRPWVRWYWPSHHVDRLELIREIDQFYHQGIGGVEIHATAAGLDPKTLSASSGLHDDFSPIYFHNVKLAITELRKRGMEADLFLGDGGTHISVEKNLKTLAFSEVHVLGGKKVEMEIPGPKIPASYLLSAWAENQYENQLGEWLDFYPDQAELITLIASKTLDENRTFIDLDLNDYIQLDFDSLYLINEFLVEDRKLVWDAPPGFWKLIAIYQMPTGMKPILSSVSDAGLTRNFLDSAANRHHYEYILKDKGELTEFFGNGLRGIFQQRKDLMAENLFSKETLPQFSDEYSYDLLPYLPSLLYPGQNNSLMEALEIKRHPEYVITEADERIRRDYETINSHLLNQRFYSYSASWFSNHGLIHRTQPFGFNFDIIRAAGNTPIPETSQFYGGGSELFLKMVVSGANLYQRNLVSAQALSHPFQAGTMAPWKMKLAVDKLFTTGVNHLVLDGAPYQKVKGNYTETGWNPFLSPYFPYPFSSSISEKSPFWEHFPEMNAYMSRCQYML
ncbi:MAG: hypothetical protein KDD99_22090, partial [Bacteroidetes bacterium]|nr:hypothetical protein [Bacteroidota bacterium]